MTDDLIERLRLESGRQYVNTVVVDGEEIEVLGRVGKLFEEAASALTAAQARIAELETSCGHCGELDKLSDRLAEVEKQRNNLLDLYAKAKDRLAEVEKERDAAEDSQIRWAALAEKFEKERNAARASACPDALPCERLTRMAAAHSQALKERDEARAILAGSDAGSLPNHFTLEMVAQQRMADLAHAWDRVERGDARCQTFETERDEARAALDMYRDAVLIDVLMEGPKFMGSDASALKRAWEYDRSVLSSEDVGRR